MVWLRGRLGFLNMTLFWSKFRKLKYELNYNTKEVEKANNSYDSGETLGDMRIDNDLLKKEIQRLKSLISSQQAAYAEQVRQNDYVPPLKQPINLTYDKNDLYR